MSDTLVLPIVNMNGTSREELIEQRCHVHDAINEVIERLAQMAPHGRDYQGEPDRYTAARDQHKRRAKLLTDLRAEIVAEALAIQKLP